MGAGILTLNRIQDHLDGPGVLGAGDDGNALVWDNAAGKFVAGSAGVTDHGALTGLADVEDHPDFLVLDGSRAMTGELAFGSAGTGWSVVNVSGTDFTMLRHSGANRFGSYSGGVKSWTPFKWSLNHGGHMNHMYNAGGAGSQVLKWGTSEYVTQGYIYADGSIAITVDSASLVPLTINLAAAQSANALEIKDSGATTRAFISASGNVAGARLYASTTGGLRFTGGSGYIDYAGNVIRQVNTWATELAATSAQPWRTPSTRIYQNQDEVRLIIDGGSTQTKDLTRWRDNGGTTLASVDAAGTGDFTGLTVAGSPVGDFLADGSVPMTGALDLGDNAIQQSTYTRTALTVRGAADWPGFTYEKLLTIESSGGADVLDIQQYSGSIVEYRFAGNPGQFISAGGSLAFSGSSGYIAMKVNQPSTTPSVQVYAKQATQPGLSITLAAAQSADALQVLDSGASEVFGVSPTGMVTATGTGSGFTLASSGGNVVSWSTSSGGQLKLAGGGSLTIKDGASATLAQFTHQAGGTLRSAGTTRVEWDATGLGFFGTTPVAQQTGVSAATALENLGLGTSLTAGGDLLADGSVPLTADWRFYETANYWGWLDADDGRVVGKFQGSGNAPVFGISGWNGSSGQSGIGGSTTTLTIIQASAARIDIGSSRIAVLYPLQNRAYELSRNTLEVKAYAAQTGNLQEWQDSSATRLQGIDTLGVFTDPYGSGYTTFSNLSTDRTLDADSTTVEEVADVLGTLIEDLKASGLIAA